MCKQASFNIYYFETTANAILLQISQNQCVFKILHRVNANTRQSVGEKLNEKHLRFPEVHFTGYCVSVPYLILFMFMLDNNSIQATTATTTNKNEERKNGKQRNIDRNDKF